MQEIKRESLAKEDSDFSVIDKDWVSSGLICPNCNTLCKPSQRVCPECGTRISGNQEDDSTHNTDTLPDWFIKIHNAVSDVELFPHCKLGEGFVPYALTSSAEIGCILICPVDFNEDCEYAIQNLEQCKEYMEAKEPNTDLIMVLLGTLNENIFKYKNTNIRFFDEENFINFAINFFANKSNTTEALDSSEMLFRQAVEAYEKKDYIVSFQAFKKLSDSGFSKAYGYLGLAYELGLGVSHNNQMAEMYYSKSIESKDHIGVYRLGLKYKDQGQYLKAYEIYQRAIDGGFARWDDYLEVAKMLEKGDCVRRDLPKAIEYYRIAKKTSQSSIDARDARDALERLGALYSKDDFDVNLPVELKEADGDSLYALGMKKKNDCFEPDIPFAFACLKVAADKGHPLAACNVADILAQDKYPIFNMEKAKEYAEFAAAGMIGLVERDVSYAFDAGLAYEYGTLTHDERKSMQCFELGAKVKDKNCQWKLGVIYKKLGDTIHAFQVLFDSAKQGQGMAMFELAQCFEYGIGTGRDLLKAKYWYEQCSSSNYAAESDAKNRLDELERKLNYVNESDTSPLIHNENEGKNKGISGFFKRLFN